MRSFVRVSLLSVVLGGVLACARRPPGSRGAPSSAASAVSASPGPASVSGSVAPPLVTTDQSTLGRFRLRLRLSDTGESCFPYIAQVASVAPDDAWVVGACGLRGRLTASGFVDFRAPTRAVHQAIDRLRMDCEGVAFFDAVAARSEREVYVAGATRCGLDPNGIWLRPLERFDGREFHDVRGVTPFRDAREQSVAQIVFGSSSAYLLTAGDEWTGPPRCGVYELKGERVSLLRACEQPDPRTGNGNEIFSSLAVDATGALWVSGQRRFPGMPDGAPGIPILLHRAKSGWLTDGPGELGVLRSDAAGGTWLLASSAWRLADTGWQKTALALPEGASDFAVVNERDVWLANEHGVQRYDGAQWRNVPVDELEASAKLRLQARAGRVWLSSERSVWQLYREAEAAPNVIRLAQ